MGKLIALLMRIDFWWTYRHEPKCKNSGRPWFKCVCPDCFTADQSDRV